MCVIIDANTIGKVFDLRNADHKRFSPVAAWVTTGTGSVVYGGTKYLKELGGGRYLDLFSQLAKAGRAVCINTKAVDDRARELKARVPDKEFDDEHLVALVGLSKCCLVCTDDVRALPYLKRKDLYPPGVRVPFIFRSPADKKHCCDRFIVEVCPKRAMPSRRRKKPRSRPPVDI
jgi:hypothetical protein